MFSYLEARFVVYARRWTEGSFGVYFVTETASLHFGLHVFAKIFWYEKTRNVLSRMNVFVLTPSETSSKTSIETVHRSELLAMINEENWMVETTGNCRLYLQQFSNFHYTGKVALKYLYAIHHYGFSKCSAPITGYIDISSHERISANQRICCMPTLRRWST